MNKMILIILFATAFVIQATTQNVDKKSPDTLDYSKFSHWQNANSLGTFTFDRHNTRSGKGALKIVINKKTPTASSFVFLRHFPVKSGKEYTAVVYVKGKNLSSNGKISLAFQGMDAQKKFIGTDVKSTYIDSANVSDSKWKRLILTFKIPTNGIWAGASFIICTFGIEKSVSGEVFFDDFEFVESE